MPCQHRATEPALALIRYPSLRQQLANGLAQAIVPLNHPHDPQPAAHPVVLEVIPHTQLGLFRSPIALQIASQTQQPAMALGRQILSHFHQQFALTLPCSRTQAEPIEAQLWLQSPGWIYIQCSERALATGLQPLLHNPPTLIALPWRQGSPSRSEMASLSTVEAFDSEQLFRCQYAHARCCTLLRLADQEHLLTLPISQPSLGSAWNTGAPCPSVPWLNPHQQLYLQSPAEHALIHRLLQFPGSLSPQSQIWITDHRHCIPIQYTHPIPWPIPTCLLWRQAQAWSEHLLAFDRDCQIFGQVNTQTLALAQARLGLVCATQAVLAFILNTLLQVDAPIEL